jgi:hypothetical protein
MVTITFPVEKKFKAAVRQRAREKHLTMSAYIRLLLADAVLPRNNDTKVGK